ncbi:MAG: acetoacetate--CoA ligase [Planctomycetes bacterium]|nr:acetoacetate--CoA ligase [Planctomycetota bacterium]
MPDPMWTPSAERLKRANLTAFMKEVNAEFGPGLATYSALYDWSIAAPEQFWPAVWRFGGIIADTMGDTVVRDADKMPGARWFPEARLNFAENLLRFRDNQQALVFWNEQGWQAVLTYAELFDQVTRLAAALRAMGVAPGDRVAAFMPNMPEAVVAMLAAASIGALWSSCSPDFGVRGVMDRFGQIEPKVLITADGYFYNGKTHDSIGRMTEVVDQIPSIERVIVVGYTRSDPAIGSLRNAVLWDDVLRGGAGAEQEFCRLPFDHPLYIMYSSGTTGVPKCIVHGAGGTLIQHLKELVLHTDLTREDRIFYFTTCGWMMWNWLVSSLAVGATVLLYDGSPFKPQPTVLFDLAEQEGMTIFGTSAKYISAVEKEGLEPHRTHDLSSLRALLSTGSPLAPESFDFVYRKIKADLCLSSISGGTDIISCFALGNPIGPVYHGELQTRGLGMAVEVFDDRGQAIRSEKGELVCVKPFPSMPVGFWNDADARKYHQAYFGRYPNIWHHGDYAELTDHDGMIIYGRSDAVLNPGGVRIGTAEIYRQVEQLPEIVESLVVGQDWEDDVRVVLFVKLRDTLELSEELAERIRKHIRANATPRHVPAKIVQVTDIPRTKSGKIVELAVREVIHGRPVKNIDALANPDALDQYRDRRELRS